jgi:hypothetical protein
MNRTDYAYRATFWGYIGVLIILVYLALNG